MSVSHELIDRLNDLLMDDSEGYDSTINFLFQVMEQTFNNYTYDKESLNKNVVSFVGTTGAGKSTLLNYIAGVKLRVVNNDGLSLSLEVWNKDEAVATIGKGDSQSQTIYPNIYADKNANLIYLDNPGDSDTRGISQQILNSYIKYRIGDDIKQIQFLIVTPLSSLTATNGTDLIRYLNQFVKTLAIDKQLLNNVSIVFTKATYMVSLTQAAVVSKISDMLVKQKKNIQPNAAELLNIIVEKSKVGIFFQPTQDMANKQYYNPSIDAEGHDNLGTGKDIINLLIKSPSYNNKLGKNLFKLTVGDTVTVNNIINKYQDGVSKQLVNNIVQKFLEKVDHLDPYDDLVSYDQTCRNSNIWKNGKGTNSQLQLFYLSIGFSKEQTDQIMNHYNFLHELIGETQYTLNFTGSQGSFQTLYLEQKINQLLSFKSQPVKADNEQKFEAFSFKTSNSSLQKLSSYQEFNTVKIYSLYQLQFDKQTSWKFQKPKALVIFSPIWKAVGPVSISLNGINGQVWEKLQPQDVPNQPKAKIRSTGDNGKNGIDGNAGNFGANGGNFYLLTLESVESSNSISIISNAGKGSDGQNGGNAGRGGQGGDGNNYGDRIGFKQSFYDGSDYHVYTTHGGDGGNGGDSGMIGQGGWGGKKGLIVLSIPPYLMNQFSTSSMDGQKGLKGMPGRSNNGNKAGLTYVDYRDTVDTPDGAKNVNRNYLMDPQNRGYGKAGQVITTLNQASYPLPLQNLNLAEQIGQYYNFLLSYLKNQDISKKVALIILTKIIGDFDELKFRNNAPTSSKNSKKQNSKIQNYSKPTFKNRQLFQNEIYAEHAQKIIHKQKQKKQKKQLRQKIIQKLQSDQISSVSLLSTESEQTEVQRLIVELNLLFNLWKNYCNSNSYHLTGKQLQNLFVAFLDKLVNKNKLYYFNYDQLNQRAIQTIYLAAFNSLCSLRSEYTVINFDYLSYLYNNVVLDYNSILQDKRKSVADKTYQKNIELKITTAQGVTVKFQKQIEELLGQYDDNIKQLQKELDQAEKQKDQYVKELQKQSTLRGISSVLKIFGSVATYFGPYGQAIGGGLGLFGGMIDVLTPQLKPVTFKDLNPISYINLQNKEYSLNVTQFITSIDELRANGYIDIPSKQDLIKQANKDKDAFMKKYSDVVQDKYQDLDKTLSNPNEVKKMKDAGKLAQSYQEYQRLKYSTYVSNAVQTASNILAAYADSRNVLNEIDKARKISDQFTKTKEKVIQFINDSQQNLTASLMDMNSTLQKTNSRATLSFLQYTFNKNIQKIETFYKSTFSNFNYSGKEDLMSTFKQFQRVNSTLVQVYKQILDLQDQSDLANFLVDLSSSNIKIQSRYPGFIQLQISLQQNILMKQANNVLNAIKQSAFPTYSYYSYDGYRSGLNPSDSSIQSLLSKIKIAYQKHNLNRYTIDQYDKYRTIGQNIIFSTITSSESCQSLLKGYPINIFPDIRLSSYYQDAIKFNKIRIQFSIQNPDDDPAISALSLQMNKLMTNLSVQITSSGDYYYRFNNRYFKINGPLIDVSQAYLPQEKISNVEYDKIKNGDRIFSPFTNWNVKIVDKSTLKPSLYDRLSALLKDQIHNLQLTFIGDGIYIDTKGYNGDALVFMKIDKCYQQFETDLSETIVDITSN